MALRSRLPERLRSRSRLALPERLRSRLLSRASAAVLSSDFCSAFAASLLVNNCLMRPKIDTFAAGIVTLSSTTRSATFGAEVAAVTPLTKASGALGLASSFKLRT